MSDLSVAMLVGLYEQESTENRQIIEHFRNRNVHLQVLHPDFCNTVIGDGGKTRLFYKGDLVDVPDRALIRMINSPLEWDTILHRQFELSGVRCMNSSRSLSLGVNKINTYQVLSSHGIAVPRTMVMHAPLDYDLISREIGFPCVVKINNGGCGMCVYLCRTRDEFEHQVEFIDLLDTRRTILFQEYIGERVGEDIRVWTLGGRVAGAVRRRAVPGEFRSNNSRYFREDRYRIATRPSGGTVESVDVSEEIADIAERASRALGLDIAGLDFLADPRGPRICEVNPVPDFKTYANMAEKIVEYVMNPTDLTRLDS